MKKVYTYKLNYTLWNMDTNLSRLIKNDTVSFPKPTDHKEIMVEVWKRWQLIKGNNIQVGDMDIPPRDLEHLNGLLWPVTPGHHLERVVPAPDQGHAQRPGVVVDHPDVVAEASRRAVVEVEVGIGLPARGRQRERIGHGALA